MGGDVLRHQFCNVWISAIATLTSNLNDVSVRVQSESEQLRDEKSALATDIAGRVADLQNHQQVQVNQLTAEIRGLAAQLRNTNSVLGRTNDSLDVLAGSVSGLSDSIQKVDTKLSGSITRQEGFEKFVVGILLRTAPPPPGNLQQISARWRVSPNVFNQVVVPTEAGSSLTEWFEAGKKF